MILKIGAELYQNAITFYLKINWNEARYKNEITITSHRFITANDVL